MKRQLDLALEEFASVIVASAYEAVQSNGALARLKNECDLNRHRRATEKCWVSVLHMKLEAETSKIKDLE